MILAQRHDGEARQVARLLRLVQVLDPVLALVHVTRLVPFATVGAWHALRTLAIGDEAQAGTLAGIPKVPVRRRLHLVIARQLVLACGVAQRPGALIKVRGHRRITPAVTVHAHLAIAVQVVEQDVVTRDGVLVRRDVLAINRDLGIAIADGLAVRILHVAQHLVIGAVLFDDVEHMLDRAGIAHLRGDHAVVFHDGLAQGLRRVRAVLPHLRRVACHLLVIRLGNEGHAAFQQLAGMNCLRLLAGLRIAILARTRLFQTFAVAHQQGVVVRRHGHRSRIPAAGNEAFHLAHLLRVLGFLFIQRAADVHHHHAVVVGIGDEERLAIRCNGQPVRRAAFR